MIPIVLDHCPTCQTQVAPPNVRIAGMQAERDALEARYQVSSESIHFQTISAEIDQLKTILAQSRAVVNVSYHYLIGMLEDPKQNYLGYQKLVDGGVRKPSAFDDDRDRLNVESLLFGSAGRDIIYAALSGDGIGLVSYGELALSLLEPAIGHRASLLEENSYFFIDKHAPRGMPSRNPLPLGYRSIWTERNKLGIAKLGDQVTSGMDEKELNALILSSNGNRSLDKFIEIHIFGTFDNHAITEIVCCTKPKSRREEINWEAIQEKATELGITIRNV